MAEEKWIKDARRAIESDASVAFAMCEDTAVRQEVELSWVIEEFKKAFDKEVKKNDGK